MRKGWCGAASHGSSSNQPRNDCGSLTRTRTSTRPARAVAIETPSGRWKAGHARVRAPSPVRLRRRVEANLADVGSSSIHVRVELPSRPQRVDEDPPLAREHDLAQVHVPVARARPADVLTRRDGLTGDDHRVDVAVPEVADVREAAHAARRREEHRPALDREHAVRAPGRRAGRRPVVADGDVHTLVIDRTSAGIRPGVEKRASDGMLPIPRAHGPAAERVVVGLLQLELSGDRQRATRADGRSRRPARRAGSRAWLRRAFCASALMLTLARVSQARW